MSASILRKLHQAQARLQNGDAAAAASLCEDVLKRAPQNAQALWLLGTARLAGGRVSEAVPLLERALEGMPQHGIALEHLGLGYLALNRFEDAEGALRRAAALPGAPASVHMRLGIAVLNQQRAQEAVAHLQKAVALAPDSALCHLNLGRAIAESGGDEDAREHFERALSLDPGEIDAIFNLGVLALKREDFSNAQTWFEKTLAREPRHADALTNLGVALQAQRRLDEALASFRRALAINPTLAAARNNLARTLLLQGNPEAAREEYLAAIAVAPALLEAREGVAAACAALGRHREAIAQLSAVVANDANNARAWTALGDAYFQMGELENAQAAATRGLEIDAGLPAAYALLSQIQLAQRDLRRSIEVLERGFGETGADGLLGMLTHQLRRACDWRGWTEAWREMRSRLDHGADLGSPFWLLHENVTAHEQLAYTRRWAQERFGASARQVPARAAADGGRRLRIGYLSSDLQEHALAYLIAGVLEKHDRERFEIFAYSYGPDEDTPMRERLKRACEHFIDVAWEPDDAITRRIREDDIDILIDLKGYTLGARTTILARRPCAIQVNWLGYPGTMGAPFIDYLITDGFIVAPEDESAYSERVLRLKHCWQCNDRSRPLLEPLTRQAHGLREDDFVFCCFTQAVKITPEVFECWMRLLASVPRGVLWLADDNAAATQNLRNAAQTHGIAPEKLVFAPRVPFAQHLARYRTADLALDTFPYTSHSTASDALWAGCPIVALCGDTFASRVSGSILKHAGLADLITRDLEQYEALAFSLATRPEVLEQTRARVDEAKRSALFDAEAFARDLERLYVEAST